MLRVTLAINASTLADYEIRNVCAGTADHTTKFHACKYTVREIVGSQTGEVLTTVKHFRASGDLAPLGAHLLATKALLALIDARPEAAS